MSNRIKLLLSLSFVVCTVETDASPSILDGGPYEAFAEAELTIE